MNQTMNILFWKQQSPRLSFLPTLLSKAPHGPLFISESISILSADLTHMPAYFQELFVHPFINEIFIDQQVIRLRLNHELPEVEIDQLKQHFLQIITELFHQQKDISLPLFQFTAPSVLENKDPLISSIDQFLQKEIAPGLAAHGGRVVIKDFSQGNLKLEFGGGCQGCSQVSVTVREGVEKRLKAIFPQILQVLDVTDHQQGQTPYFS